MSNMDMVRARFWAKVDTSGDCWLWTAAKDKAGYGRMHYLTGSEYAHRISFWLHGGVIPKGKVVDHKCRVRHCVNPSHLQILTRPQNTSRGTKGKFKDYCSKGHSMNDPENVYWYKRLSGKRAGESIRICVECNRQNARSQASANIMNRE